MSRDSDFELTAGDRNKLLDYLRRCGLRTEDAEDVIQIVSIAAFLAGAKVRSLAYFIKAARREVARCEPVSSWSLSDEYVSAQLDHRAVDAHYEEMRLRHETIFLNQTFPKAIRRLRPVERETVLRWALGESPTEIADSIGAKASTVRSWLKRSLEDIRRFYGVDWEPVQTAFELSESRADRIAEIAGVSAELVRHLLVETEYSNAEAHHSWLKGAADACVASWVREVIQSLLPGDTEEDGSLG